MEEEYQISKIIFEKAEILPEWKIKFDVTLEDILKRIKEYNSLRKGREYV